MQATTIRYLRLAGKKIENKRNCTVSMSLY